MKYLKAVGLMVLLTVLATAPALADRRVKA
jgi:hypothetical protein